MISFETHWFSNNNLRPPPIARYLTKSEVSKLTAEVNNLQKDTGWKLRVLAQAYPQTPGLAVKDYWGVDDDTIVFVADPGGSKQARVSTPA